MQYNAFIAITEAICGTSKGKKINNWAQNALKVDVGLSSYLSFLNF